MASEGALWITDLTQPDPTFILPCILGAMYLTNNEIYANNHVKGFKPPLAQRVGRFLLRTETHLEARSGV